MNELRFWISLATLVLAALPATVAAQQVRLRPIDRATVRVVGVGGNRTLRVEGRETGLTRLVAMPRAGHGTGVVVSEDGLVVTARHVVRGMDALAVVRPGESLGIPARVVFVHPVHDVAILQIPSPVRDFVALPTTEPTLETSEQVTATGYPIDHRERFPAAVSGVISRQNNDGSLQLAMGVNEGNSGGPVVNQAGVILGILTRRGDPDAGVESIALIEPLRVLHESVRRAITARAHTVVELDDDDAVMARVVTDYVRTDDESQAFSPEAVLAIRAAAAAPDTPEEAAIVASHAWNTALGHLEELGAPDTSRLTGDDRRTADELFQTAARLAERVDALAPYVRGRYAAVRTIRVSHGRPFVQQNAFPPSILSDVGQRR
jgi:S1-C subfamily serine protease